MKTLDEMIEKYEGLVKEYQHIISEGMSTFLSINLEENEMECRQVAEWLRELSAYREGIVTCGHCKHMGTNTCNYCMFHYSNYFEDEEVEQ